MTLINLVETIPSRAETHHWSLPVDYTDEEILDHEGFVYLITNKLNGKMYIGKKYIWSRRSQKQSNGRKKWLPKTESDWRYYESSSKLLKHIISVSGKDNFKFEILELYKTRSMTNFKEVQFQMICDVLHAKNDNGEYKFYNENISCKYFRQK